MFKKTNIPLIIPLLILALFMTFCASADVSVTRNLENAYKPADYSIVVYGDTRTNHLIHEKVVDSIMMREPDVVFHTGDLVANGFSNRQWRRFMENIKPITDNAEFFPALGNHEFNSKDFYRNFELPNNERWYSVERNNIHFIVLDSNASMNEGSEQYKWLVDDLKSIGDDIKFVSAIYHHPIFSTGKHGGDEKRLMDTLLPLFDEYDVDIVFNGHNHTYERSLYNDTYHIISGGGGAPLYGQRSESEYSQMFIKTYHFCELFIKDSDTLVMNVFDINLELIDNIEIKSKKVDDKDTTTDGETKEEEEVVVNESES